MAAKKKPLETLEAPDATTASSVVGLSLPPARSEVTFVEATPDGMKTLLNALRGEKKVL